MKNKIHGGKFFLLNKQRKGKEREKRKRDKNK